MTDPRTLVLPVELPSGPECDRCISRLQDELGRVKGVSKAAVNNARTTISVSYDPDLVTIARIELDARQIGARITERIDHVTLELRDLDCPDCAASIEKTVGSLPGVLWAAANYASGQMHVEFERGKVKLAALLGAVESHDVRACPILASSEEMKREIAARGASTDPWYVENRRRLTLGMGLALLAAGWMAHASGHPRSANWLFAGSVLFCVWPTARAAVMSMMSRTLDMNVLMTIAVIGAAAVGEWAEAAMVVTLFGIGNLLQAGAMDRTRRTVRSLMELGPTTAHVVRGRAAFDIAVDNVRLNEVVLVKPGEPIPLDGVVDEGTSSVNEAPITGESAPVCKAVGDAIFAGTINGVGSLQVRVTSVFRETVLSRIIQRVEEAQAQRAPVQQLVDRFARRYTPFVVGLAAMVAVGPPLLLVAVNARAGATIHPEIWYEWALRGLSLLIIACPCALVISTPVAVVTAIGSAARRGVLVKGGAYLEEIGRVRAILYDKTGTLTTGTFRLEDIVSFDSFPGNDILRIVAAIEARSEHPVAGAFADAIRPRHGMLPTVTDYHSLPGQGVSAKVDGRQYLLGNPTFMAAQGISLEPSLHLLERAEALRKTTVVLAEPGRALGFAVLSDTPRAGLAETIRAVARMGVVYQAMLTGDNPHVAEEVARSAGLTEFKACLLPEQKLNLVREYREQYGSVAMVGDGINDAPALAAADVGISMGAAASGAALETADVALMGDDLSRLPYLMNLSRRMTAIVRQNIAFSLATKAVLIVAAISVGVPLWLAVAGDMGVSLLVTGNALRLLRD